MDCACIPHIASGLGGGLKVGEVCGAASGGVLAIGLIYGQEGKEVVRARTREFVHLFTERNDALRCRDLLGVDLTSVEGAQAYQSQELNTKCRGFVRSAVALLLDLMLDTAD